MTLKIFAEQPKWEPLPERFVAIYADASSAVLFFKDCLDGYASASHDIEGVTADFFEEAGFHWFIPLPDDFPVWSGVEMFL